MSWLEALNLLVLISKWLVDSDFNESRRLMLLSEATSDADATTTMMAWHRHINAIVIINGMIDFNLTETLTSVIKKDIIPKP